jgi:NADP-dependent aldehyde dehydrogenase
VGVFALLRGPGREVGEQLVHHPAIQAVGFTGSRAGGLALCRIAQSRPQPIPVYAEMSAINPVFLLPAALAARTSTIARGFVDSLVLGAGQFCTNPGVVLGIDGPDWRAFVAEVARALGDKPAATMLSSGIHAAYEQGTRHLAALPVERVGQGQAGTGGCAAQAVVHETSAAQWLATPALAEEVFGPSSVLVRCADAQELRRVAEALEGQLTATLHLEDTDLPLARGLLPVLERKAGRILANGFPTGVEVSHAMVHGGPFPATSDGRTTSVGAAALGRFLRPVCYQDLPEALLPPALQSGNPLGVWRSVDGTPTAP